MPTTNHSNPMLQFFVTALSLKSRCRETVLHRKNYPWSPFILFAGKLSPRDIPEVHFPIFRGHATRERVPWEPNIKTYIPYDMVEHNCPWACSLLRNATAVFRYLNMPETIIGLVTVTTLSHWRSIKTFLGTEALKERLLSDKQATHFSYVTKVRMLSIH